MAGCCPDTGCDGEVRFASQRSVLSIVLAINAVMFVVEGSAALLANSTALAADSLDMLGDTLVYAFSLWVVARGAEWKARAALLKGLIMAGFGFLVLMQAGYRLLYPALPSAPVIGGIGLLALTANSVCLWLLWRHRTDDINMRSVWLCSRNDIIANVGVLGADALVWATGSRFPDILIGVAIAAIFLRSAADVLRGALSTLLSPSVEA